MSDSPRIDWAALKAWIAEKEALEAQAGQPSPLTEAQTAAIAVLLRPPPRPEPTLGGQNWIGLLNHFLQVRNQKVAFTDEARQDPRLGKAPELRWACFVTFETTGDKFPRPGYGVDDGAPKGPDFTRKQDAKQFAAKCACDWLMNNGQMTPSGKLREFPLPFGPAAHRVASNAAPAPTPASTVSPVPAKRAPSTSPPTGVPRDTSVRREPQQLATSLSSTPPKPKKSPSPEISRPQDSLLLSSVHRNSTSTSENAFPATTPNAGFTGRSNRSVRGSESLPSTKRVEQLANRLNLPVPRYDLREDPSFPGADFWSGTADFDDHPHIPVGLGNVTKTYTKKATKEKMADEILRWMYAEQEKRSRKKRLVLGE